MTYLRGLQPPADALRLAVGIVDDKLDRVDALGRVIGSRAASTHKLGQLSTQGVIEGFEEAHPHEVALALGQTKSIINADRDVRASADKPSRAICAAMLPGA